MILADTRERTRFMRFAVVGVIGAVVDFGVANLLVNAFHFHLTTAGTISFIAAILSNFTWNRYWTYPDSRSKNILRQLSEFSLVSVIGLTIRFPVLAFLKPAILRLIEDLPIHLPLLPDRVWSDNITLAIAILIVMFWNFFINRYWTYRDVDQED